MSEQPQGFDSSDIDKMIQDRIREALQIQADEHRKEMDALLASLAGTPVTFVAEHAGGPGTEIAPTWSLYEQELSRAGKYEAP